MFTFNLTDFLSVRDLYAAVNRSLIRMEEEKEINCDVDNFLDLMRQIDYLFELCVTDNPATDDLFRSSANITL